MRILRLAICLGFAVGACKQRTPEQPTAEQSAQLNEAEDMLNSAANEEGPETNAPGPSNSTE